MSIYNPKCTLCPLHEHARTVCMPANVGDRAPWAMIVGEAPGVNEDVSGSPFVGQAGSALNAAIRLAGVTRAHVTITNVVKCRPPNNRTPMHMEMMACATYLAKEIIEYDVSHVLTLGNAALEAFLGISGVTTHRGTWRYSDYYYVDVLPTFHPAYVMRQRAKSEVAEQFRGDVLEFFSKAGMGRRKLEGQSSRKTSQ